MYFSTINHLKCNLDLQNIFELLSKTNEFHTLFFFYNFLSHIFLKKSFSNPIKMSNSFNVPAASLCLILFYFILSCCTFQFPHLCFTKASCLLLFYLLLFFKYSGLVLKYFDKCPNIISFFISFWHSSPGEF